MTLIKKLARRFLLKFWPKLFWPKKTLSGTATLYGKKFRYHHQGAFKDTFHEIFTKGIYSFKSEHKNPTIIDCGANMGLSLLFFSKNYPNAKIFAFEPDESVYNILEENIKTFDMGQVVLYRKAVWTNNGSSPFYTDKGMGGRLKECFSQQQPKSVEHIRLKDFIGEKSVDFLKLDVEGAEYPVLKDCESILPQIAHLFVEYHSPVNAEQKLDEILLMLKRSGFRYHLSQSFSRSKPFTDSTTVAEIFDMAINIFAYRKQ